MSKLLAFAMLLSGLMMAGPASAFSGSSSSLMNTMGNPSQVKAAIVSKTGDMVRIYAPDNKVLCKGDLVPVFSKAENVTPESTPPMGRATSDLNRIISSSNPSDMKLIGEVRVENLIGTNYVEGRLVVGGASHGDIVAKPSSECLKQPEPSA